MVAEIDFLRSNGAHRVREHIGPPTTFPDEESGQGEELDEEKVDLDCEVAPDKWKAIPVRSHAKLGNWPYKPSHFIDGKDVGRTVAWLRNQKGYPVPVRLSQIGAVVMRNDNGVLRRDFASVERVVSLAADYFPWYEVENFAMALKERGFRMLICQPAKNEFDFERMRKATANRSLDEMTRLEKQALVRTGDIPTLVDGRLEPRVGAFDQGSTPVIGMTKTLQHVQLHEQGWRVFYELEPGQRTPGFLLREHNLPVIAWYLRLDGEGGQLPNWGIVRLEVTEKFFDQQLKGDWRHLNYFSQLVWEYRCKDQGYGRAPVSIHPIQRAEESLGALFTESDSLISHFYRLTGL